MIEKETILEFLCRRELYKFLEIKMHNNTKWSEIFSNNNLEDSDAE